MKPNISIMKTKNRNLALTFETCRILCDQIANLSQRSIKGVFSLFRTAWSTMLYLWVLANLGHKQNCSTLLLKQKTMKTLFLIMAISPLLILSCGKKPIEPIKPVPFEFKSSGTVKYNVSTLCNGYPLHMINAHGNISDKVILTQTWSTSFIRSRGDSVRIGFNCTFNTVDTLLDGSKLISRIYYQDQLLFSDTSIYSIDHTYPYTYSVTSLGVLP
jgi:hypothetical protein